MDASTQFQIMDVAICISQSANIIGKGMNPTILSSDMGKIVGQNGLFVWQPELWIQTC